MQTIDVFLRSAAIGAAVLICLHLLRAGGPKRKVAAVVTFFGLAGCYALVSSPAMRVHVAWAEPVLILGAILLPVAFVWAVLEILFDQVPNRRSWIGVALLSVPAAFLIDTHVWFALARGLLLIGVYLGLLYLVATTGADDLVEKRRVFRRWFVGLMAVLGVAISVVEIGYGDADLPGFVYPLQALALFVLALLFGQWALVQSPDMWPVAISDGATPDTPIQAKDALILRKLEEVMSGGAWRQEGLTIGQLASSLGFGEHQLRTTINQHLKFRNFSTYINGHRIDAAKQALDDPDQAGRTVLEIAYDVGFSSLGPFNKAFRLETGQSPREYRQRNH